MSNLQQEKPNKVTHLVGMNISGDTVSFEIGGAPGEGADKYTLKPGQKVRLRVGYLQRHRNGAGSVVPSIVERMTDGRIVPMKDDAVPGERVLWPYGAQQVQPMKIPASDTPMAAKNHDDESGVIALDAEVEAAQERQPKKAAR